MVQIPLISGIYGRSEADFERSVPVNLTPIAEPGDGSGTGISKGYLATIPGVMTTHDVEGENRGAAIFGAAHLRVIGSKLLRVMDGSVEVLGDVGDDGKPVQFAEGFGRIAIASNLKLFYWDGTTLTEVTDPDLGNALSVTWSDGYFITTDGSYIVVTELNDPTSVDPLKYGSSEADPDPIIGVMAQRGEVSALNRYTIEKFINAGTTGFPFQRSRGSQIPKGVVGSRAYVPFVETFAFCGSARNETAAIYLAGAGQAIRISPRALDQILAELTGYDLERVHLEALNNAGLYQLYVHLPAETWVYHWTASQLLDLPVWSKLAGGVMCDQAWAARHYLQVGNESWCGTSGKIGKVDPSTSTVFDGQIGYRFDTPLIYNEGRGAIVHQTEITFRGAANVAMSYTNDGISWSQERFCSSSRLVWRRLGRLANFRGYRFRGVLSGAAAFARLEVSVEPLNG